jgi:hypothetical protein
MQGLRRDSFTRFRIFPQAPFLHPGRPPELVTISTPCGLIGPGPSDHRLYVANPVGKRAPYGIATGPYGTPHLTLPPWRGPILPPVQPGADGHFDHIPPGTQEFLEAHSFAIIRFVMDVWERYFGRPITFHFARDYQRLEVLMLPSFDNAHCGYGFMEVGADHRDDGGLVPFALNFDVVAHEFGHLIIYGSVGIPAHPAEASEYFGFQESAADTTAMIAALHFESLIEDVLAESRGNLYSYNELNRFAELARNEQIRLASNAVKLSAFADGWDDEHDLSQPLTGAIFDILVDIFQENLVARGLVSRTAADLSDRVAQRPELAAVVQSMFDEAYPGQEDGFRAALIETRDYLGTALAMTWERLSPDGLDYAAVARTLLAVEEVMSDGRYGEEMRESFAWREIGQVRAGPRRAKPDKSSHAFSARTVLPEMGRALPKMSYRERFLTARGRAR